MWKISVGVSRCTLTPEKHKDKVHEAISKSGRRTWHAKKRVDVVLNGRPLQDFLEFVLEPFADFLFR